MSIRNIDISILPNYPSVIPGEHTLNIISKANLYEDSDPSETIVYNKLSAVPTESIALDNYTFSEVSQGKRYDIYADDGSGNVRLLGTNIIMPNKGDVILLDVDGTEKQFRVLNTHGTVAEVLSQFSINDSIEFGESPIYANSVIDNYINITWYNTLSDRAKSLIVDKTFTQDSWYRGTVGNPVYEANYGDNKTPYQISLIDSHFGEEITRHAYALSIQDIIDYLDATPSMTQENTTLTKSLILPMFFNISSGRNVILRSTDGDYGVAAQPFVDSISGGLGFGRQTTKRSAHVAFQIDLSQIYWDYYSK